MKLEKHHLLHCSGPGEVPLSLTNLASLVSIRSDDFQSILSMMGCRIEYVALNHDL